MPPLACEKVGPSSLCGVKWVKSHLTWKTGRKREEARKSRLDVSRYSPIFLRQGSAGLFLSYLAVVPRRCSDTLKYTRKLSLTLFSKERNGHQNSSEGAREMDGSEDKSSIPSMHVR